MYRLVPPQTKNKQSLDSSSLCARSKILHSNSQRSDIFWIRSVRHGREEGRIDEQKCKESQSVGPPLDQAHPRRVRLRGKA